MATDIYDMVPHMLPCMGSHMTPHMIAYMTPCMVPHMVPYMLPNIIPYMLPHMIPYMVPNMTPYIASLHTRFHAMNKTDQAGMLSIWYGARHEQHLHTWVHKKRGEKRSFRSQVD